jgi:hypothetical protein
VNRYELAALPAPEIRDDDGDLEPEDMR